MTRRLGEGGIGEVFHAIDETLGRDVAIKRLRPELAARTSLVERFRAEAQTLARLNHPNIATLYALENGDGAMCMVMEYVEGETIARLLRTRGPLGLEDALRLAFQALDGIGYAHARGVIHRDIKGSNLMLDAGGTLKIMDFGIARVLGEERRTRAGQLVGTPEFMAPEQIRGGDADERSDLYSLAILLYALLSGRGPFRAPSEYDLMKAQVETAAPSIREDCPELPAALDAVLARALAKRPEDRFPDARSLRSALEGMSDFPTPSGDFVWPQGTPRGEAETWLLSDSAADPEAATLRPGEHTAAGGRGAGALPLIEAEPLSEPEPATPQPERLSARRRAWPDALAAFALVGALLAGVDLLGVEGPRAAARAVGAPAPTLSPGSPRPWSEPDPARLERAMFEALAPPIWTAPPSATNDPEGDRRDPIVTPRTTRAQAEREIGRSREPAPSRPARATRGARPQGDDDRWVIRRH